MEMFQKNTLKKKEHKLKAQKQNSFIPSQLLLKKVCLRLNHTVSHCSYDLHTAIIFSKELLKCETCTRNYC